MSLQENPYEAPVVADSANSQLAAANDRSMFTQLQVVGILQVVAGVMELMMGAMYLVSSIVFFMTTLNRGSGQPSGPPAFFLLLFIGLSACVGISGCLRLVSGISSFYFRHRRLMLISLGFGFISVFTCYCAATAVPVGIYGLIVLLSPAAQRAYALRLSGRTPDEIRQAFSG